MPNPRQPSQPSNTMTMMFCNQEETTHLQQRFPSHLRAFCKRLNAPVCADVYEVVPMGIPAKLWFTYDSFACCDAVFIVTEKGGKTTFKKQLCCFDTSLSYGTILEGILHLTKNDNVQGHYGAHGRQQKQTETVSHCFCVSSILQYKGSDVSQEPFDTKYQLLTSLFSGEEIRQLNASSVLHVFAPILVQDYPQVITTASVLPYNIYGVRCVDLNRPTPVGLFSSMNVPLPDEVQPREMLPARKPYNQYNAQPQQQQQTHSQYQHSPQQQPHQATHGHLNEAVPDRSPSQQQPQKQRQYCFEVEANLEPDSYSVFRKQDDASRELICSAHIPTYETSKMMNSLFRRIRENDNIDLIEESEDEDDFQNVDNDKFLQKGLCLKMLFDYDTENGRLIPSKVAPEYVKVSSWRPFIGKKRRPRPTPFVQRNAFKHY